MNKRRRPYSVNGAVLIMVLTVMFVLIFLLAGAVAVVYTSNNRVMMQYEESQAYYTARSVLETYRNSLLSDNGHNTGGTYYYVDSPTECKTSQVTQGRALELDLYKVPVCTDPKKNPWIRTSGIDVTTNPNFNEVNIVDSTCVATGVTNFNEYRKQYTQTKAWDSTTMKTLSDVGIEHADQADDVIIYEFKTGLSDYQRSGTANVLNKFADSVDPSDPNGVSDVKLIVEVVERQYLGLGSPTTDAERATALLGSRVKDNFRIKVVAVVTLDGETVTTSAEFGSKNIEPPPSSQAVTAFGGVLGSDEISIVGGVSSMYAPAQWDGTRKYNFQNNGAATTGDVFLSGDVTNGSEISIHLDGDTDVYVGGSFKAFGNGNPFKVHEGGYNVVCDEIDVSAASGAMTIGAANKEGNFVTRNFVYANDSTRYLTVYGRLYTEKLTLKCLDYGNPDPGAFTKGVYGNQLVFNINANAPAYLPDTGLNFGWITLAYGDSNPAYGGTTTELQIILSEKFKKFCDASGIVAFNEIVLDYNDKDIILPFGSTGTVAADSHVKATGGDTTNVVEAKDFYKKGGLDANTVTTYKVKFNNTTTGTFDEYTQFTTLRSQTTGREYFWMDFDYDTKLPLTLQDGSSNDQISNHYNNRGLFNNSGLNGVSDYTKLYELPVARLINDSGTVKNKDTDSFASFPVRCDSNHFGNGVTGYTIAERNTVSVATQMSIYRDYMRQVETETHPNLRYVTATGKKIFDYETGYVWVNEAPSSELNKANRTGTDADTKIAAFDAFVRENTKPLPFPATFPVSTPSLPSGADHIGPSTTFQDTSVTPAVSISCNGIIDADTYPDGVRIEPANGNSCYKYVVDVTKGDVNIQLGNVGGGNLMGEFCIYHGATSNNCNFYFVGDSSPSATPAVFDVYYNSAQHFVAYDYALGQTPSDLNVGPGGTSPYPHIQYYADKSVGTIKGTNGGSLQGYINCPNTDIDLKTNGAKTNVTNVTTRGSAYGVGNREYQIIGSVLCKNYATQNKPGIIYIQKKDDIEDKGKKLFTWNERWYSRS